MVVQINTKISRNCKNVNTFSMLETINLKYHVQKRKFCNKYSIHLSNTHELEPTLNKQYNVGCPNDNLRIFLLPAIHYTVTSKLMWTSCI